MHRVIWAMFELTAVIVLAVAPGLFWLWYFYQKDRCKPEPLSFIITMFILGILVTFPVAFLEQIAGNFFPEIILFAVAGPIIEEVGKFAVVRHSIYRSPVFDEPVDGIIYAVSVGLGFATLENVLYVGTAFMTSLPLAIETGVVRALLSVPGHALFAVMWGYALGQAKYLPPEKGSKVVFGGLVLAIVFHGLFNFLLFNAVGFAVLVLVLVPVMWLAVGRRIELALGVCHAGLSGPDKPR
jgi:RsiW-degrading membrane proteinase PrsW (M82 family)